jgi:type III secretory pathway lipoprotein EscJ
VAEDVAAVEPLLTSHNDKGEVEGVKYDRVGVVLVNAVKEQQQQIESQQEQIDQQKELIKRQQMEIDALKQFVCSQNPAAKLCQPKN